MRKPLRIVNGSLVAIALVAAGTATARKASTLTDLVGARGSSGESQLEARGFTHITTHEGGYNTKNSYWWHAGDKNCVQVETFDGRYTSITDATRGDCNQSSGGNAAAAIGAVGAVALIAALASHKSHHHEDRQHLAAQQEEAEYERGYSDGLHAVSYHNYANTPAYSRGYEAGVQQHSYNTANRNDHHGRGGYRPTVDVSDLTGARASSADGDLTNRGFRNVDGFKTGNTAYTIWYRHDTRQCLQMTVAEGRVYDLRDIGQHPQCRK